MFRHLLCLFAALFAATMLNAQAIQFGMETTTGKARTTFKGNLAGVVGFSEFEISESDIDDALDIAGISAPNWLKRLFPGIRIDIDQELNRQLSRNIQMVRFYARFKWVGASFSISDPRLIEQRESEKFKNQFKAARFAVRGESEALAEHLALMAVADAGKATPFFKDRYDIEVYVHLKEILLGSDYLVVWGRQEQGGLDVEVTAGLRFSADPSPVVDLGSVLFISEKLDSLMEGGLLDPVENTTDQIAEAVQNLAFGRFKDPRTVPSTGWFVRTELPIHFGRGFSLVAGGEFSMNNHTQLKGTKPMTSLYGFAGIRWGMQPWGKRN
jgi:hypothetical protein